MRSFRNNNRRSRYRSNGDRNFKRNGENHSFTSNTNFQRKSPGRNNHNASKLIEKYNNLAREALSGGDKILSENYFQHADHFTRILSEQEINKRNKFSEKLPNTQLEQKETILNQDPEKISEKSLSEESEVGQLKAELK